MATDYASVTELRDYLNMGTATAGTAHTDDTFLGLALDTAAQAINQYAERDFTTAGTAAASRYFTYSGPYLAVPDFTGTLAITGDADDDATWETTITNFTTVTRNANSGGVGWTEVRWGSTASIPTQKDGICISATWGWSSTPSVVKLATLIQAARFWKRRESPFGRYGSAEFGNETSLPWKTTLDPDVQLMVQPYMRGWAAL